MKKIPTLYLRDENHREHVTSTVNPECQWVLQGEGVATRKLDGTSCLMRSGRLYRRYEVKAGKTPPADFEPADDVDPNTGKQPGWVPVGDGPEDKYHREAFDSTLADGTYELLGPKINGNPESMKFHVLHSHESGHTKFVGPGAPPPLDYDALREWLLRYDFEGIVWHHPDGRMAKIKRRDFE